MPRNISVLQECVIEGEVFWGLPTIRGQDGCQWTVCCRVFQEGNSVAPEQMQPLLLAVGRQDVSVEVETLRTTKTGKIVRSGKHVFEAGTNLGKSNETTALQTAIVFMQAQHRKMSKTKEKEPV